VREGPILKRQEPAKKIDPPADAVDIDQALGAVGVKATRLVNAQVVRSRVVTEMNRLIDQSKRGDFVIVSFSGHGMRVPEYPRWKGIDPSGANSQIVLAGYGPQGAGPHDVIADKEMRAWLTRFDAKGVDVLLVVDACYGGKLRPSRPTARLSSRKSASVLRSS
jgi:hypothetical protein